MRLTRGSRLGPSAWGKGGSGGGLFSAYRLVACVDSKGGGAWLFRDPEGREELERVRGRRGRQRDGRRVWVRGRLGQIHVLEGSFWREMNEFGPRWEAMGMASCECVWGRFKVELV